VALDITASRAEFSNIYNNGGAAANVLFTGFTPIFVGLAQVHIQLPASLAAGSTHTARDSIPARFARDREPGDRAMTASASRGISGT